MVGHSADEIAQECDIQISEEELTDLTELTYGSRWRGMLPSAGGCDEFMRLYCFRRKVEPAMIKELEGRLTGLREEGERIKLHIVPLADAWKISPDAKLLSALQLFAMLQAEGKLPKSAMEAAAELTTTVSGAAKELKMEDPVAGIVIVACPEPTDPGESSLSSAPWYSTRGLARGREYIGGHSRFWTVSAPSRNRRTNEL